MKDLRYGYLHQQQGAGVGTGAGDLHIQEVKHYITPGINRIDLDNLDPNKELEFEDMEEVEDTYEHDTSNNKGNKNGGRMAPLPLHSSDSDKMGEKL